MSPFSRLVLFFFLVAAPLMMPRAAIPAFAQTTAVDRSGSERNGVHVTLRADGAPAPGGTSSLTFEATTLMDAPDLQINWLLPEGVEMAGEASEHRGAVATGVSVQSVRELRFAAAGTYKISVQARYSPNEGIRLGATAVLFYVVREQGATVTDRNPNAVSPMGSMIPGEVIFTPAARDENTSPEDDCFDVSGSLVRTERPPTQGGLGAPITVPMRNVRVELREEDTISDDTYGVKRPDANGNFTFDHFCDDDGIAGGDLEIYLRVWAEVYSGDFLVAEVVDGSLTDPTYAFVSQVVDGNDGGTLVFNLVSTEEQSSIFNILDAVFDAWDFWRDSGGDGDGDDFFDDETEVEWGIGEEEDGSFYDFFNEDITIADDPSDPDEWDDSVIIHEWNHFADDLYSCDDNPGGDHSFGDILDDPELAWGEGYGDYYQSAVRQATGAIDSDFYIDSDGGSGGFSVDLERFDVMNPDLVSTRNEAAVAAALWDLNDAVDDGQDRVDHGHTMIQDVITTDDFESNGDIIDDDCTFRVFAESWVDVGKPADTETAAAVEQNTGLVALGSREGEEVALHPSEQQGGSGGSGEPLNWKWWNQSIFIADNSASMAGPRFQAVKTVLLEQVNDLGELPEGTEIALNTFNNTTNSNTVLAGQFFPENMEPVIQGLNTSGANDPNCDVNALRALQRAVQNEYLVDAWLFTDGDTTQSPSVENIRQLLSNRQARASFAIMGLCPAAADGDANAGAMPRAAARPYLGFTPDDVPGGVVPYLLTAIASGGQFLFVDAAQTADAADILLAQMTHSAGAGRWSDYVSDTPTFEWDELASWEYNWINAQTGGTNWGQPNASGYVQVNLPDPFPYYSLTSTGARAYENGYLTFNSYSGNVGTNTHLPNPAIPNNAIYPFWDDLQWIIPCRDGENAPDGCGDGRIYSKQEGPWHAIQYSGYFNQTGGALAFEVQLNKDNGEIRYLYDLVSGNASSATIGLENAGGSSGVEVSYNTASGASSGMGYKFTPAPPQPTRVYTVTADSMMQGLGFLLTGYSGSFESLKVRTPAGNLIVCGSPGVLCLDLDLVQYVQVNVAGRTGVWSAEVDAGPTGEGTFSLTSFATGALAVRALSGTILSTANPGPLLIDIGAAIDNNVLSAHFSTPDGSPFGNAFTLYDDGNHDDQEAGDGIFGSGIFSAPGAGLGYLWVNGTEGGVPFVRAAPAPFTFQPLTVTSLGDLPNNGFSTVLRFFIRNEDVYNHCYDIELMEPEGWNQPVPATQCLIAGGSTTRDITVSANGAQPNTLPSGTSALFTLAVTEQEQGVITGSDSVVVTRRRPPADIVPQNHVESMLAGDVAAFEFLVLDAQGVNVADGTVVNFSAANGNANPGQVETVNGIGRVTFTGGFIGNSILTASTTGGVSENVAIQITGQPPDGVTLAANPVSLPADGASQATLTATVRDRWGDPVPGQRVRFVLEGDDPFNGAISGGGESVIVMTNGNGVATATYSAGTTRGVVGLRAEVLVEEGGTDRVAHEARVEITLGTGANALYLPLIRKE